MTDRPQYGEYATPEEQRRLAGLPPLDAAPEAPVVTHMAPAVPGIEDASKKKAGPPWDRIITIALLAYGLINVFTSAMSYLDLPTLMNESMGILGIEGEFSNFAQAKICGPAAVGVLVLGWVITAWVSVRRLRTGKVTWWVPLVGAAVSMLLVSFCLAVPMMGDPAFIAYLDGTTAP